MEVEDLFVDLADGVKLLKLLEIISGEKLGKPNSGKMRVHKIENVNKSLAFLHTKVNILLFFSTSTGRKYLSKSHAHYGFKFTFHFTLVFDQLPDTFANYQLALL